MKAAIAVHGRFHGFDLARELQNRGVAVSLATTYPALIARRWIPAGIELHTIPLLEALRRVAAPVGALPAVDVWLASRFARFAAHTLPSAADIFVGWSGASLEAIEIARSRGMRIVVERGSSHIAHQAKVLGDEHGLRGLAAPAVDPRMIEREVAEYEASDAIAVPTRYAAATFVQQGVDPGKLIVSPYGADTASYIAMLVDRPVSPRVRILFVGAVGLRKGVPYLLQAFSRLDRNFELHLVGPVEPAVRDLLRLSASDRLHTHGPLRGDDLKNQFSAADVFCLPSLEEGLSLALLQAMAAGLPVVATPETGVEDVMTPGQEDLLVPARDVERLAEALASLASHERRLTIGAAARRRVATDYTWRAYGERTLAAYRELLDKPVNPRRRTG